MHTLNLDQTGWVTARAWATALRVGVVTLGVFGALGESSAGEARCLALGNNCMCSEPMSGPETAVGGVVPTAFDFVSSDDATECWGRGSGYSSLDSSAPQQQVQVTRWGGVSHALRQTTGFFWMYGRDPLLLTSSDRTICYRYYKQVDPDYGSAGGDSANAGGACPNTTWRNKLMQSSVGVQQVQLEEDATYNCPPPGQWNRISISIDNGPSEGNYALQPAITLGSCVSAPCRIEFCVDGNLAAGTNIRYRAQIVPVATGVVHSAVTPTVSPGVGPTNKWVWGGDMFHSSPFGDANHGFFMHAVWPTLDEWIGAATEIEGSTDGGSVSDAGSNTDGGPGTDGGVAPDGGGVASDGGVRPDGGVGHDGGPLPDAGTMNIDGPGVGCGCSGGSDAGSTTLGLFAALIGLALRRRRNRPAVSTLVVAHVERSVRRQLP